jgi:hypothetical protein
MSVRYICAGAVAIALAVSGLGDSRAADAVPSADPTPLVQVDPQSFVGTWHDGQDRFWFTVDAIEGNQVRAARFWLASLKEGHVDGDTLTLVSRSCVPIIGCYEYTHVAKMTGPDELDLTGTSDACRFWHECKGAKDEVNQTLTRQ